MAVKTYRKTALVTAEQFLPAICQIPKGVFSDGHGDPRKRPDCKWVLDTKEGRHDVRGGDYICTGPAGEQWNVAKEIFEATYEEVSALQPDRAGSGDTVRVKALEWTGKETWKFAKTTFGAIYTLRPCTATNFLGKWLLSLEIERIGPLHDNEEAAKAAAQADYDQRVRAALTTDADRPDTGKTHPLAKFGSPTVAPLGLYRVHWKSGGSSLAAIGMMENGDRWIAPTNWLRPGTIPSSGEWGEIERLEPIEPTDTGREGE